MSASGRAYAASVERERCRIMSLGLDRDETIHELEQTGLDFYEAASLLDSEDAR